MSNDEYSDDEYSDGEYPLVSEYSDNGCNSILANELLDFLFKKFGLVIFTYGLLNLSKNSDVKTTAYAKPLDELCSNHSFLGECLCNFLEKNGDIVDYIYSTGDERMNTWMFLGSLTVRVLIIIKDPIETAFVYEHLKNTNENRFVVQICFNVKVMFHLLDMLIKLPESERDMLASAMKDFNLQRTCIYYPDYYRISGQDKDEGYLRSEDYHSSFYYVLNEIVKNDPLTYKRFLFPMNSFYYEYKKILKLGHWWPF